MARTRRAGSAASRRFASLLLLLAWGVVGAASERPLFADHTPLRAVLTAPLSKAYAEKSNDVRPYLSGHWAYTEADGSTQKLDVSIRTRGLFRRENCRLPPLQLNFRKKQTAGTLFAGQDKLKLVAPCANGASAQQRLMLEYLAYRIFEVLTDYSLKTRLLRLSYIDSNEKKKPWTHLAFVIEDEKDMAARLSLTALRIPALRPEQVDPDRATLVELFQYFIGNTDFSILAGPEGSDCCHNTELLGHDGDSKGIVPVPYDFDFSGFVNARYASPSERLPIRNVRQRLYRGRCRSSTVFDATVERFRQKRAEIHALVEESPHLQDRYKKQTRKFIDDFYEVLDDPKKFDEEITSHCRGSAVSTSTAQVSAPDGAR